MTEGIQSNQFIPSIVIALDKSSVRISQSVRNIFFRRNYQQQKVCDFYTFTQDPEQDKIIKMGEADARIDLHQGIQRPDIYNRFISQVNAHQESLAQFASSIEDHNRLIDAGYILDRQIPINYYVIADAKDGYSGGVILPLVFLINNIVINHQNSKLHVLLNVAHFAGEESNGEIEVYTLLHEIKEVFNPNSDANHKLCESLKIRSTSLNNVSLYLFHNKKEAAGEVVDNDMMEIMIGNALLSMMVDDISRKFARTTLEANIRGEDLVYNSVGSVVLAYDPDSLQKYCSNRLALKTIDDILLANGLVGSATSEANRIKNTIGDFHSWTQQLLKIIPDPVSQVVFDPDTKSYSVVLKKINLKNIVFLDFKDLDWKSQIEVLELDINNRVLPACQSTIGDNGAHLLKRISLDIERFIEQLPLLAQCFPGGIDTARMTLRYLRVLLLEEIPDIHENQKEIQKSIRKPKAKLNKIKYRFFKIAKRIPSLPKIIDKIPERYQELSAATYYHVFYLFSILILRWLRGKVPRLLQVIAGAQVQMIANQENLNLIETLCGESGVIDNCLQDLDDLYKQVASIRYLFSSPHEFPLGQAENSWTPFFRIPAMTESVAQNIYTSLEWSKSDIIDDLIVNKKLFADWMTNSSEIFERVSYYHMGLFKDVWDLDLFEVCQMITKLDTKETNPLKPDDIHKYMSICQPLLRPVYETGELEQAQIGRYHLMGDTSWSAFEIPANLPEKQHWEKIWINDKYSLIFTQAWHNLPYGSIAPIFSEAEKNYHKLSRKGRSAFGIVLHRSFVSTISETDEIISREYQWQFSPKGSNQTYTHYVRLDIDRARYHKCASEERIKDIKQWDHYAQSDMPELNNLAIAFQKIFSEHDWSTYNKAFCVLKFVQNAITYQKDKVSKGTQQWSRYPIETLAEGTGDCEDVSILCVAILVRMGFDVVLLYYPDHPDHPDPGHVAFGVCGRPDMQGDYVSDPESGRKYYFGEATNDGWLLGEIPEIYKDKTPEAIINIKLLVNEDNPQA
jgi:hypothetical protein